MTGNTRCILFAKLLVILQLVPQLAYPGAWTQQRGHFYSKLSILRFSATAQFTIDGTQKALLDNGKVTDLGLYYYLEYGLFDDLTLITNLPFKRTAYSCAIENCNKSSSGLGDIYFGFRYRLSQDSWVLSLQSGLKLPMGYETDVEKLDSAPPLGDGQVDFDIAILIGRSVLAYRGYLNLGTGYRTREGEPVDELALSAEFGYWLTEEHLFTAMIYGVKGISDVSGQTDFRIIDGLLVNFVGTGALEEFLNVRFQLFYKLSSKLELSFEFSQVLAGRNTTHATIIGGGIVIHN